MTRIDAVHALCDEVDELQRTDPHADLIDVRDIAERLIIEIDEI